MKFDTAQGAEIVLNRIEARARGDAIRTRFGVPVDRSPDLLTAAAAGR